MKKPLLCERDGCTVTVTYEDGVSRVEHSDEDAAAQHELSVSQSIGDEPAGDGAKPAAPVTPKKAAVKTAKPASKTKTRKK